MSANPATVAPVGTQAPLASADASAPPTQGLETVQQTVPDNGTSSTSTPGSSGGGTIDVRPASQGTPNVPAFKDIMQSVLGSAMLPDGRVDPSFLRALGLTAPTEAPMPIAARTVQSAPVVTGPFHQTTAPGRVVQSAPAPTAAAPTRVQAQEQVKSDDGPPTVPPTGTLAHLARGLGYQVEEDEHGNLVASRQEPFGLGTRVPPITDDTASLDNSDDYTRSPSEHESPSDSPLPLEYQQAIADISAAEIRRIFADGQFFDSFDDTLMSTPNFLQLASDNDPFMDLSRAPRRTDGHAAGCYPGRRTEN